LKKVVTKIEWAAVLLATIGLGLLSLRGWAIGFGEFLTLLCALFFALHIIGLGEWSSRFATYPLTVVQLGTVTVFTGITGFSNGYVAPPDSEVWKAILITAFLATSAGFLIQTWAQSHMDATSVAVILTLEVVFAALVAVIAGQEILTARTLAGGSLIVVAMIAMQVNPKYYLSRFTRK
jgi:drug/metabolite transporter (DMT)-like permease